MKKLVSLAMAVLMTLLCAGPVMAKGIEPKSRDEFPDVDGNGILDVEDVSAILKYKTNDYVPYFNYEAADMDHDGNVTTYDAHLLLVWLSDHGLYAAPAGAKAVKEAAGGRTAVGESPYTAFKQPFLVLQHDNANHIATVIYDIGKNSTNGLAVMQFDPSAMHIFGWGINSGYVINIHYDHEKGTVYCAYAMLEPYASDAFVYAIFPRQPQEDTMMYMTIVEYNQLFYPGWRQNALILHED